MDTQTQPLITRRGFSNPRVTHALRRAAEINAARRLLEGAGRPSGCRSYLSPASIEEWALLLSAKPRTNQCEAFYEDALRTAVRYQAEVLRKEDPFFREVRSAEEEIERCIGSDVPFATLAALLELTVTTDPTLAQRLLCLTCKAAQWPILFYLDRNLGPHARPLLQNWSARKTFTAQAVRWLERMGRAPE